MDNELLIVGTGVKLEHFPIIFQKLLFRDHSSTAQLLLQIVLHDCILNWDKLGGSLLNPGIILVVLSRPLRNAHFFIELPGVLIAVHQPNILSVYFNHITYSEILRHKELAVFIDSLLPFEEDALRDA
jgi:hypothetical protein